MSSFKPIDGSKEDFRKYLDRKGVLDAITKVLIKCNSDRPENAIEYLLENLGEKVKDKHTIACLESDLADARNEIEVLKRQIESLQVSAASPVNAGIKNVSSPVVDEAADKAAATNEDATDKEGKVPSATETVGVSNHSQEAPAEGDSTGTVESSAVEVSEPTPKEQAPQ